MADRTRPRSRSRNAGPCSLDDCDRPAHARGWCNLHYQRWKEHGDPLAQVKTERVPPEVRFWRYVERSDDPHGCWLWTGSRNPVTGYGTLHIRTDPESGRPVNAYVHRFTYELHVGPIPDGLTIDHLCCVRHCVNPSHLEPVTQAENSRRGAMNYWRDFRREPHLRERRVRPEPKAPEDFIFRDSATRVLLAVMSQDYPTVRSVSADVGIGVSATHAHLRRLKAAGLVTFEPGQAGTLRAIVAPVRFGGTA